MGRKKKESRKYPRRDCHCLIRYHLPGGDTTTHVISSLRNISCGGAMIRVKNNLAPGCEIAVSICMPQVQKTVHAIAKVVWVAPAKSAGTCLAGIEFIDLNELEKEQLYLFSQPAHGREQ